MLILTESGAPRHIDPVPYVESVPSRREATAAFFRVIAALNFKQCDDMEADVEILRRFICSR